MNLIATKTISINKNPHEVFDYISNMENFARWFPEVISIEASDELAHGSVGKRYQEIVKVPLKGNQKIELKVVKSNKPTQFCTEGKFLPLLPRMEIQLKGSEANTDITWSMFSRNNHFLFKILMLPLIKPVIQKRANMGLGTLKKLLES